jgi:hypothetical protein
MKLELQNYAAVMPVEKINNKLNSLQKYASAQITEFYIEWFSVCPNITSIFVHHRHILKLCQRTH